MFIEINTIPFDDFPVSSIETPTGEIRVMRLSFDYDLYEKNQRQKHGEEVMIATRSFVDNFR